jgi:hypothetical protein
MNTHKAVLLVSALLAIAVSGEARFDTATRNASESPPAPPPSRFAAPVVEQLASLIARGVESALCRIRFLEPFNDPVVNELRGRLFLTEGDTVLLRLAEDANGNGIHDPSESILCDFIMCTADDDSGCFTLDILLEQTVRSEWLLTVKALSFRSGGKMRVSFDSTAFWGEDTFLEFPGFETDPVTVGVEDCRAKADLPGTFQMSQNYPNPFNPEARKGQDQDIRHTRPGGRRASGR